MVIETAPCRNQAIAPNMPAGDSEPNGDFSSTDTLPAETPHQDVISSIFLGV
jgi:hypothetical protein